MVVGCHGIVDKYVAVRGHLVLLPFVLVNVNCLASLKVKGFDTNHGCLGVQGVQ